MANLEREGADPSKVRFVGNVMTDTLMMRLPVAKEHRAAEKLGVTPRKYGVVMLHRPSNVDDPAALTRLIDLLHEQLIGN